MFGSVLFWLPSISDIMNFEVNLFESLLQGVVSTSGILVLCNLLRVHFFIKAVRKDDGSSQKEPPRLLAGPRPGLGRTLHLCCLISILTVVGPRVASLVVLEFSLRAVAAWVTVGSKSPPSAALQFMVSCQFSLGCALSCSLHFLQEGAPQRLLSLLLAAGLSWILARQSSHLWHHVMALYPLHSSQRYCGVCLSLVASSRALLPLLTHSLMVTFCVAAVAAISIINHHFLSAAEALRFWTPLTICYMLLVVHTQEEQHRRPGGEVVHQTVMVRLGGLLLLMLMVGWWTDVLHMFICFLGEACCLIPSRDLQDAVSQEMAEEASSCLQLNQSTNSHSQMQPESDLVPSKDKDF
ncbi:transmembrane protein 82-like isoform X1 [Paramormyrops kingsleyae]|uniref:transmembrane protein 82-like isoform X1 n=1 Tax=Paramormyrops kingsleyae TaxID=1676925 RepID=UPI003B979F9C